MLTWQDALALTLVALAAATLLRRGWRLFFQQPRGCGACGTCPASEPEKEPAITTIALLPAAEARESTAR